MDLLLHSIEMDWPVLLPILICSILTLAVAINRFVFFNKNKRDVVQYIPKLQRELSKNNLEGANNISQQMGGVMGEVTEEAVRIFAEQKKGFSRSFDIATSLATRKLEHHLTILATIGGVCPFLGLIGNSCIKLPQQLQHLNRKQLQSKQNQYHKLPQLIDYQLELNLGK